MKWKMERIMEMIQWNGMFKHMDTRFLCVNIIPTLSKMFFFFTCKNRYFDKQMLVAWTFGNLPWQLGTSENDWRNKSLV